MTFCLDDGSELLYGPAPDGPPTAILPDSEATGESPTRTLDPFEAEATKLYGDRVPSAPKTASKRATLVAGGVIALLVSALGFGSYWFFGRASTNQIESIAVMPFVNESGNADNEYLSDGMTETLINSLSKLPNLGVKGRSSVFRYKGKDVNTKTLAAELGVQAVLYGYVAQRGNELSLNLELLDAATENVLWSGKYDRERGDVLSLQSEIARDVSRNLKAKLSGEEAARVEKGYTANPEAYRLYLQGRFFWNKRTGQDVERSIGYFNKAIALDPAYALAYSGLAESYVVLSSLSSVPPDEAYPKARAAAMRSMELDPNLAGPHAVLGSVLQYYDWNQAEAEKEYKRAIELDANYPSAHQWFSYFLLQMGRVSEGIGQAELAYELDPFSPIIAATLAICYRDAHRFDDAIAQFKKTLEIQPGFGVALTHLYQTYLAAGRYEDAIGVLADLGMPEEGTRELKLALSKSGKRGFWQKLLEWHENDSREDILRTSLTNLAQIELGLGDKGKALDLLEKAVANGKGNYDVASLGSDVRWDDLREEPRFKALLRKIGLPED